MEVQKEDNQFDRFAMTVSMPKLKDIPEYLNNELVKKGPGGKQTVKEISRKIIGRVPANFVKLFRELIDSGAAEKVTCISTGEPTTSKMPPVDQSYQKIKR